MTKRFLLVALLLTLVSTGLTSCVNDGKQPAEAIGPAGEIPLLDGAEMISEDSYFELIAEGRATPVTPAISDSQDAALDAQDKIDEELVNDYVEENADEYPEIRKLTEAPAPFDDSFKPLDDSNYELKILTGREFKKVITLGDKNLKRRYAEILRTRDTKENQAGLYRRLYEALPVDVAERYELTIPSVLDQKTLPEITAEIVKVGSLINDIAALLPPGGFPPAGYPSSCAAEEGAGPNTDRTPNAGICETHKATGIYNNYVWPLKYYATCVKDQANRGTCGSFGITAALESAVALQFKRWVNLSEQDLYYQVKNTWWPSSFGDGVNTHEVWKKMLANNYLQGFENQWNYNPSNSRITNAMASTYTNSCTGYQFPNPANASSPIQNFCSNTNHQGGRFCVNVGPWQYCGNASAVASNNVSGFRANNEFEAWNPTNTSNSLAITQLVLQAKLPAVLWAYVTPTFDNESSNGFVNYTNANETNRGSHIYEITGYISNTKLQQILPNAPLGAGGGYIIAKNSWGVCYGDAGYVYLPYNWVKSYAISVTVLDHVQ